MSPDQVWIAERTAAGYRIQRDELAAENKALRQEVARLTAAIESALGALSDKKLLTGWEARQAAGLILTGAATPPESKADLSGTQG